MCGHACRIEELDIGYIDGMLLLPLIQEHTIDERSPLCGHTHDSLMAVSICLWPLIHMSSPKTDTAQLGIPAGSCKLLSVSHNASRTLTNWVCRHCRSMPKLW